MTILDGNSIAKLVSLLPAIETVLFGNFFSVEEKMPFDEKSVENGCIFTGKCINSQSMIWELLLFPQRCQ